MKLFPIVEDYLRQRRLALEAKTRQIRERNRLKAERTYATMTAEAQRQLASLGDLLKEGGR